MEDEYLELEMDQQEHFHQPSVPKEHSRHAEVGEDGAHYGVSRIKWPIKWKDRPAWFKLGR